MTNAAELGGRLCLFVARSALSLGLQALNGTPQSEEPGVTSGPTTATTASYVNVSSNDGINNLSDCVEYYRHAAIDAGLTYCNATYDSFLCWPPTAAGTTVYQNCPEARLSDTSRLAYRRCGLNGLWLGRRKNESSVKGWTNYTPCFPAEVQDLFGKMHDENTDTQNMYIIAKYVRYLEIVGFSASFVALVISLYIFYTNRSLNNIRTNIHKHLFQAMLLQVVVRLVLYIDQELANKDIREPSGISNMPFVCLSCYILLEYAISSMFGWMFIEGAHLLHILTANALREITPRTWHYVAGWGLPLVSTVFWVYVSHLHYSQYTAQKCWYGYNFIAQYWFVQGPRLFIVVVNFLFLLYIIYVLVRKLKENRDPDIEIIRKATRAALVLLPLLGITNSFNMVDFPLDVNIWCFALWMVITHFLRSFQGLFLALSYCFLNAEVQEVLKKSYRDWKIFREDRRRILRAAKLRRQRLALMTSETPTRPLEWTQILPPVNVEVKIEMPDDSDNEIEIFQEDPEITPSICANDDSVVSDEF